MNLIISLGRILVVLAAISYTYFGWVNFIGSLSLGFTCIVLTSMIFLSFQLTKYKIPMPKLCLYLLYICFLFIILDSLLNNEIRIKALQQFILPLLIFLYSIGIVYYLNFISAYLKIFASLIIFSSLIAILQSLDINFAWTLREMLPPSMDMMVEEQISERLKPAGMSLYSVQLGYQQTFAGCMILILHAINNNYFINNSMKFLYILLLISSGLSQNLSPFFALTTMGLIHLYYQNYLLFDIKNFSLAFLLILGIIFSPIMDRILYVDPTLGSTSFLDSSILSRVTFMVIGIRVILSNPFGVALKDESSEKLIVINDLFGTGNLPMLEDILNTSFHNTFINIGVQLGWLGLFLYLFIYLTISFDYYKEITNNSILISKLSSIGLSFMIGYLFQCFTHNAGPFHAEPFFWMANGILYGLIAVIKVNTNMLADKN